MEELIPKLEHPIEELSDDMGPTAKTLPIRGGEMPTVLVPSSKILEWHMAAAMPAMPAVGVAEEIARPSPPEPPLRPA